TLYYLLAGQVPFPAETVPDKLIAHQERTPKPLSDIRPDLPPAIQEVINKMMAKNPAERYQTPAEMADVLGLYLNEAGPAGPPVICYGMTGEGAPPVDLPSSQDRGGHSWGRKPGGRRWTRMLWAALIFLGLFGAATYKWGHGLYNIATN